MWGSCSRWLCMVPHAGELVAGEGCTHRAPSSGIQLRRRYVGMGQHPVSKKEPQLSCCCGHADHPLAAQLVRRWPTGWAQECPSVRGSAILWAHFCLGCASPYVHIISFGVLTRTHREQGSHAILQSMRCKRAAGNPRVSASPLLAVQAALSTAARRQPSAAPCPSLSPALIPAPVLRVLSVQQDGLFGYLQSMSWHAKAT